MGPNRHGKLMILTCNLIAWRVSHLTHHPDLAKSKTCDPNMQPHCVSGFTYDAPLKSRQKQNKFELYAFKMTCSHKRSNCPIKRSDCSIMIKSFKFKTLEMIFKSSNLDRTTRALYQHPNTNIKIV